jgi:hypothetical protein
MKNAQLKMFDNCIPENSHMLVMAILVCLSFVFLSRKTQKESEFNIAIHCQQP